MHDLYQTFHSHSHGLLLTGSRAIATNKAWCDLLQAVKRDRPTPSLPEPLSVALSGLNAVNQARWRLRSYHCFQALSGLDTPTELEQELMAVLTAEVGGWTFADLLRDYKSHRDITETFHPDLLKLITTELKAPAPHSSDEAFEMKVLVPSERLPYEIYVEAEDNTIRFTMPACPDTALRVRVWLKRKWRQIDDCDTSELDRLIQVIQKAMPNIGARYAPNYIQLQYQGN